MVTRVSGATLPTETAAATQQTEDAAAFREAWQTAMGEQKETPVVPAVAGEVGAEAMQSRLASAMRGRDGLEGGLMMLCMLMSQNAAGLDPMMATLSSMIALLSNDDALELWKKTMNSDYATDVLDDVDEGVFDSRFASDTPYQAWKPTAASVVSPAEGRSPETYRQVIDQFNVTENPRYEPNKNGKGDTYCNIFSWDVTRAMDAEIPHYTDPVTGDIDTYPDTKDSLRMNANRTYDWLAEHGERYGWYSATAEQAQAAANLGQPAVTVLKRPGAHGHIQMVCPSEDGGYDAARGVSVAQAGTRLTNYDYLNDITAEATRDQIAYYVHA